MQRQDKITSKDCLCQCSSIYSLYDNDPPPLTSVRIPLVIDKVATSYIIAYVISLVNSHTSIQYSPASPYLIPVIKYKSPYRA